MAFQSLGNLLPTHLKRVGWWSGVERQKSLARAHAVLCRVLSEELAQHMTCVGLQNGVLILRVSYPAVAAEVRMKEQTILVQCKHERLAITHIRMTF
ncbi:MAG: DUF721 domain-containing protein [Candidatus Kerfeldbacteria bacterium]|nr:DUF721 domain-containing protein [Candidatus Kerfeldbacteria bacterium]